MTKIQATQCKFGDHELWVQDTPFARYVANEVLEGRSYPQFLKGDVANILDIGANVGAAALWFHKLHPQARIYCFEPDPAAFKLLCRNTEHLKDVHRSYCALADRDGTIELRIGRSGSHTSSLHDSPMATRGTANVVVQDALQAIDALALDKIGILKLDTEGSEVPILRSLSSRLNKVGIIYVEYHSESDRREVDHIISATHTLYWAQIQQPHLGVCAYMNDALVPSQFSDNQIRRLF